MRWGKAALLAAAQWLQRQRPSRCLQFVIVGGIRRRDCWFVSMAARFTCRFAELHSGGPTVVLEAGMGSFSPNWYWVQEELAPTVRSVAYDRAGLGWSRRSRRPRDAQTIATELRDALREAAIEPPYVLAGHSFGGLPVRAFADLYPELTAGLVLVDASHPDQWVRWPTPHADKILEVSQRIFGWLGWLGVLRALEPFAWHICRAAEHGRWRSYEPVRRCQVSLPPKPRRSTTGRSAASS